MDALLSLLPNDGAGWTILAVVLTLIFGTPAILSEEVSKKRFWLISAAARKFQNRRLAALEREDAYDNARARINEKRIADIEASVEDMRARHEEERDELRRDIEALRDRLTLSHSYIQWTAQWAHDVILAATEYGIGSHLPRWQSYTEWRNSRDGES